MKVLDTEHNFLGIEEPELYQYDQAKVVIQSAPYEHTSSYVQGSDKGPSAIIDASHFVEFFDEEIENEHIVDLLIFYYPKLTIYIVLHFIIIPI